MSFREVWIDAPRSEVIVVALWLMGSLGITLELPRRQLTRWKRQAVARLFAAPTANNLICVKFALECDAYPAHADAFATMPTGDAGTPQRSPCVEWLRLIPIAARTRSRALAARTRNGARAFVTVSIDRRFLPARGRPAADRSDCFEVNALVSRRRSGVDHEDDSAANLRARKTGHANAVVKTGPLWTSLRPSHDGFNAPTARLGRDLRTD